MLRKIYNTGRSYLYSRRLKKIYRKYKGYTMIPEDTFVNNLLLINKFTSVPGSVVECGVWRGGMSAAIAHMIPDKNYYLFDSFEGLPDAKEIDGEAAIAWQSNKEGISYFDNCKAEMNEAEIAMKIAGVTNYRLVKGWFSDTLPGYSFEEPISILRLDGDWYESTMECLVNLFPKVVSGGVIIIDDYYIWDGCSRAVHDYLSNNQIKDRIRQFNNEVSYIIKEK